MGIGGNYAAVTTLLAIPYSQKNARSFAGPGNVQAMPAGTGWEWGAC